MTAEGVVRARLLAFGPLRAVVGSAIYAGRAPQNIAQPFVVWRRVSATGVSALDGRTGVQRGRFQVDCYAAEYDAAVTLAALVEAALVADQDSLLWAEKTSEMDIFEDEEPAMWRRSMDFLTMERI